MRGLALACILAPQSTRSTAQSVVTKRIPQPRSELSPSIRAHEAQLLAVMLRTSRLTCVFGEAGTDKSTLLKSGVLPLLQRRQGERATAPRALSPPRLEPERRRSGVGQAGTRRLEAAVYFDAWGDTPLADLKSRVADLLPAAKRNPASASLRLADALDALGKVSGLHFFFLLDRFEEFVVQSPDQGDRADFTDQLVEALLRPRLPASFLIAMDEDARPRLERFRARVPGFEHNSLRLSPIAQWPVARPSPGALPGSPAGSVVGSKSLGHSVAAAVASPDRPHNDQVELQSALSKRKPQRREPPPRVPIKVEEVYAFIEATLAKTAMQRDDHGESPVGNGRAEQPTAGANARLGPIASGAQSADRLPGGPGARFRPVELVEPVEPQVPPHEQAAVRGRRSPDTATLARERLAAALNWLHHQRGGAVK